MSSASFSSLDELELSFGSYCQTSTAFFSYKDLKDILTPTKALHTDPFENADPDESPHSQYNEISESPIGHTSSNLIPKMNSIVLQVNDRGQLA